jgi:acyl carrier protein
MNTLKAMKYLEDILNDLGIPEELIQPNALLHRDLQLDSTEIVEISLALKRRLGIKLKLETREDKSLAEVCTLIRSAIAETKSTGKI